MLLSSVLLDVQRTESQRPAKQAGPEDTLWADQAQDRPQRSHAQGETPFYRSVNQ